MKVSDLTVIMLQSDRKNIENDNIWVVSKLGQNEARFFRMCTFPIYKWFPFIKQLLVRKVFARFPSTIFFFVEMPKAILLKNQHKIMNNTLFELTSDAK